MVSSFMLINTKCNAFAPYLIVS